MKKITIFVLGVFIVFSCKNETPTSSDESAPTAQDQIKLTQQQFESSGFQLGTIEKRTMQVSIPATGEVHVPEKNQYVVSSYLGGLVKDMNLINGEKVYKGQKLFSLLNPDLINLQQEFLELKSALEYLKDEHARQKTLAEENITARKTYLKAFSDFQSAEAKYHSIAKKLQLMGVDTNGLSPLKLISELNVVANSNGHIQNISVVKGQFLKPTEPAMTIVNTDHLHVELKILEKEYAKIKLNQSIQFKLQHDPNTVYHAKIYLIDPVISEDRTLNIHCHLDNDRQTSLLPGMYIQANILIDQKEVETLPEDAIVKIDNNQFVLLKSVTDQLMFEKKQVSIGSIQNGHIEILNNTFDLSDTLLVKGAYFLLLGSEN